MGCPIFEILFGITLFIGVRLDNRPIDSDFGHNKHSPSPRSLSFSRRYLDPNRVTYEVCYFRSLPLTLVTMNFSFTLDTAPLILTLGMDERLLQD